ncbi:hypothetical protein [Cognatiyoonia sp. IB215182]|uniref:hypothetical protein n=1 Tax=Cognatiyoonia sp. IB215182 TaxID=3097353 RepID=UPI002A11E214|nr:hypothetical protein [Cognatiyoonia sp. IB215182]MDX8352978.1 hypothetical protein [Cognatiyoonia sp. IB215182]
MRFYIPSIAGLLLAGCTGTISGSGLTSQNETIAAVGIEGGSNTDAIEISSNSGWSCRGDLTPAQSRQLGGSVTVPLDCSDGRTGTTAMTTSLSEGNVTGTFRLSDGTTGQFILNVARFDS